MILSWNFPEDCFAYLDVFEKGNETLEMHVPWPKSNTV